MIHDTGSLPASGKPLVFKPRYAIVTGGTLGIGLEVARGLVARGLHTIVIGRDSGRGDEVARALSQEASNCTAQYVPADLSEVFEIPRLASRLAELAPRCDLLIHNAAIVTRERLVTRDGFEVQFAVNHLAVYSLTRALLPRMSGLGRIVITASQVERDGRIDFEDLMSMHDFDAARAYSQSKLANVLFTYELARRLRGAGITANCLHPGVVRTHLLDTLMSTRSGHNRFVDGITTLRGQIGKALRALRLRPASQDWAKTPAEGARTTLHLALAPELASTSGEYFVDGKVGVSSPQSRDIGNQRRLWDVSASLLRVSPVWPA